MAKVKTVFNCTHCAAQHPRWNGQCNQCGKWNTLIEEVEVKVVPVSDRFLGYAGRDDNAVISLADVALVQQPRHSTGCAEFDRVLGSGMVVGSVVLIGGDPGIGKSTLLLQVSATLSQNDTVLYVTGEESLQQITMRAKRLSLDADKLRLLTETNVEKIIVQAKREQPRVIIIDSIQTLYTNLIQSAPGGVGQVRESAAQLVQYAKQSNTTLFLVGHVTKEGALAGPRVLEHMVDAVLYFEGERDGRFRMLRAVKNRFGAVNELGVFAMTEKGLREVSNPSAIFLSQSRDEVAGSAVMVSWEGTRPLLVEVQALVDASHLGNPRRVVVGLDQNRLAILLAVLHRHGQVPTYDQDVFINVVGGVRVSETAADLALIVAVISSLRNRSLPKGLVVFGEIGLAGEIRPVQSGQERLKEAAKHGFTQAIVPFNNAPKHPIDGMKVHTVKHFSDCMSILREIMS